MTDIATLEREAAEHAAKAAAAQAVIAEERQRQADEHAERVRVASAEFLAGYDAEKAKLEAEEKELLRQLDALLLDQPWVKAWAAARAARLRRCLLADDAQNAATRVGSDRQIDQLPFRERSAVEHIEKVAEDAAQALAYDEQEARQRALGWYG